MIIGTDLVGEAGVGGQSNVMLVCLKPVRVSSEEGGVDVRWGSEHRPAQVRTSWAHGAPRALLLSFPGTWTHWHLAAWVSASSC